MSRGKNITSNQRVIIYVLLDQNLSQVQIAKKLEFSRCSVQNATKHITPCFFEELKGPTDWTKDNLLPYARSQRLGRDWIFQQENDPKHSSNATKPLNPMVHLWNDVEKEVRRQKPSNIKELEAVIKTAWAHISVQRCANLVDSMPRRCVAVITNFGYLQSISYVLTYCYCCC
uniref:HTH_Tnp_Tc3_1 domain-containing protein n=1 Tax=Heterorhabditis bacteriophora TaxID=37862 RepID=A0A1I7WAE3_HETBA